MFIDQTTSSAVSGLPSDHLRPGFIVIVTVFPSLLVLYPEARSGLTVARSAFALNNARNIAWCEMEPELTHGVPICCTPPPPAVTSATVIVLAVFACDGTARTETASAVPSTTAPNDFKNFLTKTLPLLKPLQERPEVFGFLGIAPVSHTDL